MQPSLTLEAGKQAALQVELVDATVFAIGFGDSQVWV